MDKPIEKVYPEIDIVTTPTGEAVAMVHTNNCTSDINAWIEVFGETLKCFGVEATREEVFDKLFRVAMAGDADCGGLLSYGYYSGETSPNYPKADLCLCEHRKVNLHLPILCGCI